MRLLLSFLLSLIVSSCGDPQAKANLDAANAFLSGNAKHAGVITLPSGLQYKVLRAGAPGGASPTPSQQVTVNYEGSLLNGQVFDSTYKRGEPATFQVGGLIPAWTEALQKMKPGDQWMLYVPPKLGYGEKGAGGVIPPNAALVFKIELIAILPDDASVGRG
ncbi:MAG TPA: FKBP-type peptidyl-prolyl cis-trans isomerase [Caulobacteraceae bacterium]|jgi:peptidylprolyl isomerase/FKBP-type peptidyl-prolyl cis-trans isomerase FklB